MGIKYLRKNTLIKRVKMLSFYSILFKNNNNDKKKPIGRGGSTLLVGLDNGGRYIEFDNNDK